MILPGFPTTMRSSPFRGPQFVAASQTTSTATFITVSLPSGVENGDLLIAFVFCGGSSRTPSAPIGWTNLQSDGSGQPGVGVYYKVANSEPSSIEFSYSGTSIATRISMVAFRGANTVTAYGAIVRYSSTATATAPAPSGSAGSALICAYFSNQAASSVFPVVSEPSGMSLAIGSLTTGNPSTAVYYQSPPGSGTKTIVWGASGNVGALSMEIA